MIPIYPSLEAAVAAGVPPPVVPVAPVAPGAVGPRNWSGSPAITAAVLRELIDALADGVALTDDAGILALANRRLEEMFGYEHAELIGQPVDSLIPADLRTAHRSHQTPYAQALTAGPTGARAGPVGLRKDGTPVPGRDQSQPGADRDRPLHSRGGSGHNRADRPVILEALIPGRMQGHASAAEVPREAARARGQDGVRGP